MNSLKKIVILGIAWLLVGCAKQTTPEGGPKDLQKPTLIKSTPSDNQKNFKLKKIELVFDEDVKLKDPKEEIIITPSPGKEINFIAVGNKVTIEPKVMWKDSTTYNVQFREAIQDITESNPTEDLQIAFSTGPLIDTLSISGKVVNARSEKIPEKITVALYTSDTFKILNHAATYLTKTDKKGNFKINNLAPNKYFIYAFEDKNKNLKLESTSEKFGFKREPITLTDHQDSLIIRLMNIDSRPLKLNSNRSTNKTTLLRFNKNIVDYKATINKAKLLTTYGDNQSEVIFYYQDQKIKDSLQVAISVKDSLNQKFDTLIYIKQGDAKAIKTSFSISTETPQLDYETGEFILKGKTNIPIHNVNFDSLYIRIDSLTRISLTKEVFKLDTITKQFAIKNKINLDLIKRDTASINKSEKSLKRKEQPVFILGKGFLTSINNDSSKRQTINLPKEPTNNTGKFLVKVITKRTNYYVELLDNADKVIKTVKDKTEFEFDKLSAGDYKFRIYIDENKNTKWDIGNIYTREEPETVIYYKQRDGKYTVPLRENWTNEVTINF